MEHRRHRTWLSLLLVLSVGSLGRLSAQATVPWTEQYGRTYRNFGPAVPLPDSVPRWALNTTDGCKVKQFGKARLDNVARAQWTGACDGGYVDGDGELVVTLKSGRSESFRGTMSRGAFADGVYITADSARIQGRFVYGFNGTIHSSDQRLQFTGWVDYGQYIAGTVMFADGARFEGNLDWNRPRDPAFRLPIVAGVLTGRSGIEEAWWADGRRQPSKAAYMRQQLAMADSINRATKRTTDSLRAENKSYDDSTKRVRAAERAAKVNGIADAILKGIKEVEAARNKP